MKVLSYDRKPVIVKNWSPDLDLLAKEVKVVHTWVRLLGLPLKYWGPSVLNKISSLIGKPIRTNRATAQKEILEYARVLVEVHLECSLPEEITFTNEKGVIVAQKVVYECRPTFYGDCGGIGHTVEECRKKIYELALKKAKPKQVWVEKKKSVGEGKPSEVGAQLNYQQMARTENSEQFVLAVIEGDKNLDDQARGDIQGKVSAEAGTSGQEAGASVSDVNLMQGGELIVPPHG